MIGSLRGRLADKAIDEVLIDVGGVGYRISIPLSTYEGLPAEGELSCTTKIQAPKKRN